MPDSHSARREILTDLIYGALFGETTWQDFLDALNKTMPDARSSLFFHDAISRRGGLSLTSGLEDRQADAYNSYYSRINPWMPKAAVRQVGLGVVADQMLAHADLVKTEFYNDFLLKLGSRSSVGVTIIREKGRSFNLSMMTPSAEAEANMGSADLLGELAPHLRRSFDFVRRNANAAERNEPGLSLFEAIGVGILYLRDDQRIRRMNAAAEELLVEGTGLRLSATRRLIIDNTDLAARLAAMSRRDAIEQTPKTSTSLLTTANGNLKCTLIRLQSDFITEFLEGPTVALIVERTNAAIRPEINDALPDARQLTAAEMRVASAIVGGLSLRETARAYDVSYETTRSHLKNIYSKLGVNSQVGLVRRLLP